MNTKSNHPSTGATLNAGDRAGLWLIAAGAAVVAVLAVVATVLSGRQMLGGAPLEVGGMPIGNARTPEFTTSLAGITEARYESVAITVDGAPQSARWLLWGADAVGSLAAVGICLTLIWLCLRVRRQRPFSRSLTGALVASSALVMVGGAAGQVLAAFGRSEIVSHLGDGSASSGIDESFVLFGLSFNLAPIGVGLALAVVALAFEIGTRLQRDTEGLV